MYAEDIKHSCSWVCMAILIITLHMRVYCDVTSSTNITAWINETALNDSSERTTVNDSLSENEFLEVCVNCSDENVDSRENETDANIGSVHNVSGSINTTAPVHDSVDDSFLINITSDDSLETDRDNTTFALKWSNFTNETTTTAAVKSHHNTSTRKHKGGKSNQNRKRKPHLTKEQYEYLVRHFTGFMPNVKVGKPTPDEDDDDSLDDGPFGSVLWRDKKYLVSVLIPIGVGVTGAMLIIVMAYATRVCRRRKVAERNPRTLLQPSVSRPDDIMLLEQSSDDEF